MAPVATSSRKYQRVYSALRKEIQSGRLKKGDRLPSEAELVRTFGASRITVGRAVRDLQVAGLVERRAGSGTYVRSPQTVWRALVRTADPRPGRDRDLRADLSGHDGLAACSGACTHLGQPGRELKEERAWQLCRQYIDRGVSGVFFAPLELSSDKDDVNERIARALDEASIPIVLLDRTVVPYPGRGHHDLVGIDNRRAGYVITEHLLRLGARKIAFLAMPHAAATVDAREAGYREALYTWQAPIERSLVHRLDPSDSSAVESLMQTHQVEAIVCANDRTASRLIPTLLRLGYSIPDAVRVVGIDDLEYAEFLPVPLTTLRQPTRQLGDAALAAMLDRVARTHLPTRDILLNCELIVRESCGAKRQTEGSDKRPPSM